MKLPTAKFPAQLREMTLVNMKPLRKPLRRLSYTLRRRLNKNSAASSQASKVYSLQSGSSKASTQDSKGVQLMLNLLLVRPWVLVLGFWLLSMGVGALSLNGMLSPRKLRMALPEPTVETDAGASKKTRSSLLNVEQAAGEDGSVAVAEGDAIAAATDPTSESSNFPFLPIAALVTSCAVGSLIISRRRAMMRLAAARAKSRTRKSRPVGSVAVHPTVRVKSSAVKSSAVKSSPKSATAKGRYSKESAGELLLKAASEKTFAAVRTIRPKKRRHRSKVSAAKTAQSSKKSRVLASRTNAQKNGTSVRFQSRKPSQSQSQVQSRVLRSQARRTASRPADRRQPMVSVVPANESHPLDWPNSSLAHQLDVRQQRSAM